jgi:hypothetical protein
MLAILLGLLAGAGAIAGMSGGKSKPAGGNSESAPGQNKPDVVVVKDPVDDVIVTHEPEPEIVIVDPEPEVTPEPEPEIVIVDPEPEVTPDPVVIPTSGSQSSPPAPNPEPEVQLGADFSSAAVSGRVTTLELPGEDIASVKILNGPDYGNVTVNPDNTLALVLTGTTNTADLSFHIETTSSNGTVSTHEVTLDVIAGTQDGGWSLGKYYMLETDETGDTIIEYGDNHREVYVSGDNDALSIKDIAALEGLSQDKITSKWLADHAEYGSSEDMALSVDAGKKLWGALTGTDANPSSHWLLFERGHEYEDFGAVVSNGTTGESALHPVYIGAYGSGDMPLIHSGTKLTKFSENIVIKDIQLGDGVTALQGSNLLIDNVRLNGESNIQNLDGFTLRNSEALDIVRDDPVRSNATLWSGHADRISGIFVKNTDGILIENSLFDHIGWGDGYDYNRDADDPQTPSIYSHNVYIQKDSLDLTYRDNISMRASSFGAQFRSGGFIEDNVFIDNNAGVNFYWGIKDSETGIGGGNYTLFTDNVITSGAHKTVSDLKGALTIGVNHGGNMPTLLDNIVAHLADPNNPAEQIAKEVAHNALNAAEGSEPIYNDTIIYNWIGQNAINAGTTGRNPDENIEGLNQTILDQTTIQVFTAQLLGQETATIADLADYLRAQADGQLEHVVDADLIITFFQQGFGLTPVLDMTGDTARFVPDSLGDGVRWDNRMNWDQDYLPENGQNVDLAGNWVHYGGTTRIEDLDFGSGGKLFVSHGYLGVLGDLETGANGGTFNIENAGQVWTAGYDDNDTLSINVDGGRFANTGLIEGKTDLHITGGQTILASDGASYDLSAGSTLEIIGGTAQVGFDGEDHDTATLRLEDQATLSFTAKDGVLGSIGEFRSGAFGASPDVLSGIHLGDGTLEIDFTGITGAYEHTLISADMLIGTFGKINALGLGSNRDATVTVNYESDTVTVNLTEAGSGSGALDYDVQGSAAPEAGSDAAALWAALTKSNGVYSDEVPHEDPEAGEDALLEAA